MSETITKSAPKAKPPEPDPLDPALVLTFADLQELGAICRTHLTDRESIVKAMTLLSTVSVEGVKVTLEPRLLSRLKSRCLDKPNFPKWLAQTIVTQLHDYAGW